MVWVSEKKVFYHLIDLGFERVQIPIRVRFEFRLKDGQLVPDSLSKDLLYNLPALQKRYPDVDTFKLEKSIKEKVDQDIYKYLEECGFLRARDV